MKNLKLTSDEYLTVLLPLQMQIDRVYNKIKKLFDNHQVTIYTLKDLWSLFNIFLKKGEDKNEVYRKIVVYQQYRVLFDEYRNLLTYLYNIFLIKIKMRIKHLDIEECFNIYAYVCLKFSKQYLINLSLFFDYFHQVLLKCLHNFL